MISKWAATQMTPIFQVIINVVPLATRIGLKNRLSDKTCVSDTNK